MRGKPVADDALVPANGNIPAYAGKTDQHTPKNSSKTEHPRVCGENGGDYGYGATAEGTSPRMRGKPTFNATASAKAWNIPAYAGKTFVDDGGVYRFNGTSPRMRGKRC